MTFRIVGERFFEQNKFFDQFRFFPERNARRYTAFSETLFGAETESRCDVIETVLRRGNFVLVELVDAQQISGAKDLFEPVA